MNLSTFSSSARGYVLLFLGIVVGALLLLFTVSELFLRFLVIPNDNFYKHLAFYQTVEDPEVAAFGDSRLSQGFYPARDDIVNLAYASENFEQIAMKIDHFLKNNDTDKIILQLEPHMFARYRFDDERRNYHEYFTDDPRWEQRVRLMDPHLRGQLLDYWRLFFVSLGRIPNRSRFTENGAVIVDETMTWPPTRRQTAYRKTRTKEHTPPENFADSPTWDLMRETIRKIKAHDADLCLIAFPVTPFYKETVLAQENTHEAIDRLRRLAAEQDVPYLFYWDLYDERYELFRNLDHLNEQGARLFTEKVLEDCGFAG